MYHHIERCRGLRRNHQDLIVLNGLQPALRQIPAVCLSSDFHSGGTAIALIIIGGTGLEREREPPAEFLRPILSNENDAGMGVSLQDARAELRARGGSFQRASEEKLRTRRIVSVADRFRHPAATRPTPGSDDSRSTSTDAPPPGSA